MSKHRRDDRTCREPLLPATVEQLAAQERAAAPVRRRVVIAGAAVAAVLAVAATAWAVAGPGGGTAAPTGGWATGADQNYSDGFGDAPSPSRSPSPRPQASPSPSVSPSPSPSRGSGLAPSPGAVPAPAGLAAGSVRSLRIGGSADTYVFVADGLAVVGRVAPDSSAQARLAATFTVVAGLADSRCFSLRAADGRWLRHRDYRLRLDPDDGSALLRADATFCARDGEPRGTVRFESQNYPGYYLRPRDGGLWLDQGRRGRAFESESSFVVTGPWV
ncbi:hypothetical protein Cs7R123_67520 [Catellatospora sp. TT07R-123]|uniref:AbfB domain-containing protein n=1 Tax=Catellatospora sp. TT07R-123 TaxID=2733863 RepID=UPI001B27F4ED|nr:AbfB domain-containing protein [Catellatospora sp. TT07R-123]GHJ49410.1 hypothetical protein Cs7R123_67520 [Catellatospora sp. TT07R-123]